MIASCRIAFGGLAALVAAAAGAADPVPLVKPATVPVGQSRIRFALESENGSPYRLKALIAPPKAAKKGTEPAEATIAIDTALGDAGYVTVKKLKSWGYDVPAGQTFLLPEVVLTGETVAPKPRAGEVRVKVTNLKLMVLEKIYGSDELVGGADLQVNLDALWQGLPSVAQPWAYFGKTPGFAANYPEKSLTRLTPEPGATPTNFPTEEIEAGRVPTMISLKAGYGLPYTGFHGKPAQVGPRVVFSLGQVTPPGVFVTNRMAQLFDLKPDPDAKDLEIFADFNKKGKAVIGQVKDLRIPVAIDPGFKTARELTSKDLALVIDLEQQMPGLYIGPGYFGTLLQEPVLAAGPDGVFRIYGYVDPKNVPVAPKKK